MSAAPRKMDADTRETLVVAYRALTEHRDDLNRAIAALRRQSISSASADVARRIAAVILEDFEEEAQAVEPGEEPAGEGPVLP